MKARKSEQSDSNAHNPSKQRERMQTHMPTDDELDACPYDYPLQWVARALDGCTDGFDPAAKGRPGQQRQPTRDNLHYWLSRKFSGAIQAYQDAVFRSDPYDDKSAETLVKVKQSHGYTEIGQAQRPLGANLCVAVAHGPHYVLALVLRGDGLHLTDVLGCEELRIST